MGWVHTTYQKEAFFLIIRQFQAYKAHHKEIEFSEYLHLEMIYL